MKKMSMITTGILAMGAIGAGAYIAMNKKMRKKAEKVINEALDDLDKTIKTIQK